MWVRLRFDISLRDMVSGLVACCSPLRRQPLEQQAEQYWSESGRSVVCLSVRSGFDLLLSSLRLPAESEVLMSALTVPDMERIACHHGLVPVPIDLVRDGCTPSLEAMHRAVTSKTRVLVIAHLFGTRVNMDPIVAFAKRHNLFVIEDCAQAYHGAAYRGHPETDASLFSFGPIKTATAFGGGVIQLRSKGVAEQLRAIQHSYDVQTRLSYFSRLAKYSLFKILAARPLLGLIAFVYGLLNKDFDSLVAGAARNFPADNLLEHLRRQPSAPLLKTLLRRWRHYDTGRLQQRIEKGRWLSEILPAEHLLNQPASCFHNYWVFPVLVGDQTEMVERMRARGFDATGRTRLTVVAAPKGRPDLQPLNTMWTLTRIVFLPWYPDIPTRVLASMARVIATPALHPALTSTSVPAVASMARRGSAAVASRATRPAAPRPSPSRSHTSV